MPEISLLSAGLRAWSNSDVYGGERLLDASFLPCHATVMKGTRTPSPRGSQ